MFIYQQLSVWQVSIVGHIVDRRFCAVVHRDAHAARAVVVVNSLLYRDECGKIYRRVSLLFELVGILRALQFVACCIVERLGSNKVVHVEVAVVSVFFHLLAVHGIVLLGDIDDIGIRYLKVFDVDLK